MKSHFFVWRGYKACISSQLPKLSSNELERRFKLAKDSIEKSKKTEEVKFCKFACLNISTNANNLIISFITSIAYASPVSGSIYPRFQETGLTIIELKCLSTFLFFLISTFLSKPNIRFG